MCFSVLYPWHAVAHLLISSPWKTSLLLSYALMPSHLFVREVCVCLTSCLTHVCLLVSS